MTSEYSIRTSLQGELLDFLDRCGLASAPIQLRDLARDLVGLLASYREEGALLFPSVFLLIDPVHLQALSPGTGSVPIHSATTVPASQILKDCAPLARDGWAIYVVVTAAAVDYGVFRASPNPMALSSHEALSTSDKLPALALRSRGHLEVELAGCAGSRFTATLTTEPPRQSHFGASVTSFAKVLASQVPAPSQSDFEAYTTRTLTSILQHCHGTLLAIANPHGVRAPAITTSVDLRHPVPWFDHYAQAAHEHSAASLATLQATETLLRGMINSDGIVVLSPAGTLLSFRTFLRWKELATDSPNHHGGSRAHTYSHLCSDVPTLWLAAFMKSQDGLVRCKTHEASHEPQ